MERIGLAVPSPGAIPSPGKVGWIKRIGRVPHFGRGLSGPAGKGPVPRTRRVLAVAAVGLAVIVAGLAGWGLRGAGSSSPGTPLSSAALLSASHQSVGEVWFYDAGSRWLYMSVNMDSGNGTVLCQVQSPDGHLTTIGSFRLNRGYGYWGSPDPVSNGPVTGARLVSADGAVLATASFPKA